MRSLVTIMGMEKKILPQLATMVSMMSLFPQVKELSKLTDFDRYSIEAAVLSALSGLLWLIYDWSSGASWIVLLGLSIGLSIQLYILYGIVSSRGIEVPFVSPQRSTDAPSGYTI